jgi:hypothetical protein
VHLLNGELIRKLPVRGFRNLQAFTGRARVQHNASHRWSNDRKDHVFKKAIHSVGSHVP